MCDVQCVGCVGEVVGFDEGGEVVQVFLVGIQGGMYGLWGG